jgi:predicted ATP-dependent endonuclease of OLD family
MLKNPLYLTSLYLAGYKSIRDAKIEFLEGLNIVIGKNGGGKTNLLEFVNAIINNTFLYYFNFNFFEVHFFVKNQRNELKANKQNENIAINFNEHKFVINETAKEPTKLITATLGYKKRFIVFNRPNEKINLLDIPYNLSINLKIPNQIDRNNVLLITRFFLIDFLQDVEKNKKTKLNNIKVLLPNYFIEFIANENLLTNLQKYSPIEDLRISPNINVYEQGFDNEEISVQNIYIEFLLNNRWHSWQMLSDGTKRLFYLITEVTLSNGIVLLEEPELGVHPHQLHQIMQFLKEQAETKQIILTTHSPQVLDVLNVDELDRIIVADITKEKGSQFRHLDEKTVAKAKHYLENDGFISDFWRYSTLEPRETL